MTNKISVGLSKSYKLLNHGPVTLVTSAYDGKSNVMAASWAMPLDFSPAKVVIIVDSNTLTRELIDASDEFGLQIPARALAQQTVNVGSVSGRLQDKFTQFGLTTFAAEKISVPMLNGCIAWLECKVVAEANKQFDLIVAEVVAAYADAEQFIDGRWVFSDDPQKRSMHYMAGGQFFATGESFRVAGGDE